jgi:hypothetical protein
MEFLILLVVMALLCLPAWYVARKRQSWFGWDYATVLGPLPFWYALAVSRVGSASMSNLIELLVVAAFVPLAVSGRVFVADRILKQPMRWSLVVCGTCFLVPLILRLAMPAIPE